MQLSTCFFITTLQIYNALAFPELPNFGEALAAMIDVNKGFECGNLFFRDPEVHRIYQSYLMFVGQDTYYPQRYLGPLYSDSETTEYLTWPIRKRMPAQPNTKVTETHLVVFTRGVVIDVISRTANFEYTKCIRRDLSQSEPLISIPEGSNGYKCGHKFLDDEVLRKSLGLAREMIGKQNKYPAQYFGNLYPRERQYKIWPIFSQKKFYKSGEGQGAVYFLVINTEGQLIETIVRGFNDNLLRCVRSRKDLEAQESISHSELIQSARSGFQCEVIFFDDDLLSKAADEAMRFALQRSDAKFPLKYSGEPFNEPCWLWPISIDGSSYKRGKLEPFRVVLTLDFQVKCIAVLVEGKPKPCDRRTIAREKEDDKSSFLCDSQMFHYHQLANAVDIACKRLKLRKVKAYPKKYEGPRFEKDGPYFTYPVFKDKDFSNNAGLHRVVFNSICEVVGALTTVFDELRKIKRLVKCQRLEDGSFPSVSSLDSLEPIFEHPVS